MTLDVNNSVAFCGKNNGMHKALKKLEQEKLVDKLGVEVPREMELAKRPKAEQMEAALKKTPSIIEKTLAEFDTSFQEKIAKILGKV